MRNLHPMENHHRAVRYDPQNEPLDHPGQDGPCAHCNGTGEVPAPDWQPDDQPGIIPCPSCDGNGN